MSARSERGGSNIDGNFGRGGLTYVDTSKELRIGGWLVYNPRGHDENEINEAYGVFDVTFCPEK